MQCAQQIKNFKTWMSQGKLNQRGPWWKGWDVLQEGHRAQKLRTRSQTKF